MDEDIDEEEDEEEDKEEEEEAGADGDGLPTLLAESDDETSDEEWLSLSPGEEERAENDEKYINKSVEDLAAERLHRLLLSFDGDIPQIQALLEDELRVYLKQNRVELLKFAAACSGKQQPNDVMKGFLVLKKDSTLNLQQRTLLSNFMTKLPQVLRRSLASFRTTW